MNPHLDELKAYPFERLARLKAGVTPPDGLEHIAMSIGEPRHTPPPFVGDALCASLSGLESYPVALGLAPLREAVCRWLVRRYGLDASRLDADRMVLPLNGTREGLFAFVQTVVDHDAGSLVMMPNPFYQIYEGATLLAGAQPHYLNTTEQNRFLPDFDSVSDSDWDRCAILFLCSPGNPTGAVMDADSLTRVLHLADKHDFIVASDECYADIYFDEAKPPVGLLQVCQALGRDRWQRCVVFHSLSKRSSVPGLRSGFIAGDPDIIAPYRQYRTYHGCAVADHVQRASIPAWDDDRHAADNRALYQEKLERVYPILDKVLDVPYPEAAFYLWLRSDLDDEEFTRRLYAEQNITVLPGSYLARDTADGNPGAHRVRLSLVPPVDTCVEAAQRITNFARGL